MTSPAESERAVVTAAFLARYGADAAGGAPRPVEDYQALFPGFEELIAREYSDVAATDVQPIHQDLGPYRVLRPLGKGGMGEVFLCEQRAPVQRIVAVKLMRPGMDTGAVGRRFEAERQALARMSHPHIASVFDAGETSDGRPYFVMEFVEAGAPLVRYCDEHALDVHARLELLVMVCDGVHHAHQRGVIHRDLKPSNVLVTAAHGKPVPKIIDFGLAKIMESDREAVSLMTGSGDLLGTIDYMSPEQADAADFDVDTRTDVYSLGVILYELLTGTRPFASAQLRGGLIDRVRTIREVDPPLPSARIAANGGPARLVRTVRGDLDWIAMRALEKERDRRYPSVAALAEDIRRYLVHEPVAAGQPSQLHRLRKFARRNKGLVAGAGAVLVVLLTGTLVATMFAIGKERQRRRAERELRGARIEQARLLARTSDLDAAEDLLWREHLAEQEPRSYWALWELYGNAPCLATVRAHAGMIRGVAYSPGGDLVATTGQDGAVRTWRTHALAPDRVLRRPQAGQGYCIAFAPDGRGLAVGFDTGEVVLYGAAGEDTRRLAADGLVAGLAYDSSGAHLAFVDRAGVHVADVATARVVAHLPGQVGQGHCVAFSSDDGLLAAGGGDRRVRVWRRGPRGWQSPPTVLGEGGDAWAVAFCGDSRLLVGGGRGSVSRWRIEAGRRPLREQRVQIGRRGAIHSIVIEPGGRTVLAADRWVTERLDVASLEVSGAVCAGQGGRIARSSDARFIAVGRANGQLRLFEAAETRAVRRPAGALGGVTFATSPGGELLAAACARGTGLWDLATGELLAVLGTRQPTGVAFGPATSEPRLAVGEEGGTVRVYDLRSGSELRALRGFGGKRGVSCRRIAFGPAGRWIAFAGPAASVLVHDVASGRRLHRWRPSDRNVVSVDVSARGAVAATYRGGVVRVFGPSSEKPRYEIRVVDPWTVAFDPAGARFLVTSWANKAEVFDAEHGVRTATLPGHGGAVWDAGFHPLDEDLVVTGCVDGKARIFMVSREQSVATLLLDPDGIGSIDFTPDGRALVALGGALVVDLDYNDRYIAGQVPWRISRIGDPPRAAAVRRWAERVLARPWPRLGPRARRSPAAALGARVRSWGAATLAR